MGRRFPDSERPIAGFGRTHTAGPYSIVRHPFYAGWMAMLLGVCLITTQVGLMSNSLLFSYLLVVRAAREEDHLLARYEEGYHLYMRALGRFLP
jgi:protein-S-isoprenylcysteine O-methyltransferase Ste14